MPKIIVSPVKKWPGTITISDPLTYPQVFAWRDAIAHVQSLDGSDNWAINAGLLPGVLACVEAWNLEGFPLAVSVSNFPATPPTSSARLLSWIVSEITSLFTEAEEVPLES